MDNGGNDKIAMNRNTTTVFFFKPFNENDLT